MTPGKAFLLVWFLIMLMARTGHCVIVGVIDTGLSAPMPHVLPGWNFVGGNRDTSDSLGHGTHVTGIITSIAPEAVILPIKYFDSGSSNLINLVKSINYAVSQDVQIINYSGGGDTLEVAEVAAILGANDKEILLVVAAGNDHNNLDEKGKDFYPCSYDTDNVICVANIYDNGALATSSNYGPAHVDVAAGGMNVYSTLPGGRKGFMSGTSMSAAKVSGIAVNMLIRHPGVSAKELKRLVLESAKHLPSLEDKVRMGAWF